MAKVVEIEVGMRAYTDIELEYIEQHWEQADNLDFVDEV